MNFPRLKRLRWIFRSVNSYIANFIETFRADKNKFILYKYIANKLNRINFL